MRNLIMPNVHVETRLLEAEYELLKDFKEKNGLKTDYQGLKELVKALDIPDFNQEQFNQEIQEEWVDELKLWFDNDGQMYKSRYIPFLKNYARKKKRGIYEKELAIKGIKNNLVNDIIKAYSKDMGGTPTLQEINMATRKKLAEEIVDRIEGEINDEGVEGVLSYKQEVKPIDRTNLENWVKDLETST